MSGMKSDWIHEPITVHDSKQVGPIGAPNTQTNLVIRVLNQSMCRTQRLLGVRTLSSQPSGMKPQAIHTIFIQKVIKHI